LASLGHLCKFQWVSRLGSVTARHSSSERQANFAASNRGRHLYSAGRPSRWALAHVSSYYCVIIIMIIIIIIIITVFVARRLLVGGESVAVARAGRAVAAVVAVSTDEIAVVTVSAVALVARRRPRRDRVGTERRQDDQQYDRSGQETHRTTERCRSRHRRRSTSSTTCTNFVEVATGDRSMFSIVVVPRLRRSRENASNCCCRGIIMIVNRS